MKSDNIILEMRNVTNYRHNQILIYISLGIFVNIEWCVFFLCKLLWGEVVYGNFKNI